MLTHGAAREESSRSLTGLYSAWESTKQSEGCKRARMVKPSVVAVSMPDSRPLLNGFRLSVTLHFDRNTSVGIFR